MRALAAKIYGLTLLVLVPFLVAGCSGLNPPPSATAFHQDTPPKSAGEYQRMESKIYRYTYNEVFDAAEDTVFRKGFTQEVIDRDDGMISGRGLLHYVVGSGKRMSSSITYAIYIEEVSADPRTRITIVGQIHSSTGPISLTDEDTLRRLVPGTFATIQKVLSTY